MSDLEDFLSRNPNANAYVKEQRRTGPPLEYVAEKLRNALVFTHSLYHEIRESVPDDLPRPEGEFYAPYSTKQDGLVGPAWSAFRDLLTAYLALQNMLGVASPALHERLLNSSKGELHDWLRRVGSEGSVTG